MELDGLHPMVIEKVTLLRQVTNDSAGPISTRLDEGKNESRSTNEAEPSSQRSLHGRSSVGAAAASRRP